MTIVRQILAAHGGSITYRSEPGKGTTFSIQFAGKLMAILAACWPTNCCISENVKGYHEFNAYFFASMRKR